LQITWSFMLSIVHYSYQMRDSRSIKVRTGYRYRKQQFCLIVALSYLKFRKKKNHWTNSNFVQLRWIIVSIEVTHEFTYQESRWYKWTKSEFIQWPSLALSKWIDLKFSSSYEFFLFFQKFGTVAIFADIWRKIFFFYQPKQAKFGFKNRSLSIIWQYRQYRWNLFRKESE
jgi:hypothetical protein